MQFSTGFLALAIAAAGVSAAPKAALEQRQTPGLIYVRFYPRGGCQGDWLEDTVYFDGGSDLCKLETLQQLTYASWRVESNEALRPLTVYTKLDCSTQEGGNFLTIAAGHTECYTQHIGSVRFGN